ncbi:MAG TPA: two-component sensor histidine kinase [Lachnospiraceae bacterium]|nr:two-component sensor histidine kinase [Lachnospiraceae bacterium]
MKKWFQKLSLYHKFALTIILVGLVPVTALTTVISNSMISDYREALHMQYRQAAEYVGNSLSEVLETYNTISKMPYSYSSSKSEYARRDYLTYDNFRQMLYGERYEPDYMEEERQKDMLDFLKYLDGVDRYTCGAHFIAPDINGNKLTFHYSRFSTFFENEDLFEESIRFQDLDAQSTDLHLITTHRTGYFKGMNSPVFTVGRNYFDLRGDVGDYQYVGTLFLDVDLKRIAKIFQSVKFSGYENFYVVNEKKDCLYSNEETCIGQRLKLEEQDTDRQLMIETQENKYGISVIVLLNTEVAFQKIRSMQNIIYLFLGASMLVILAGSMFFSRRLTRPIQAMMKQMEKVGTGDFDIQLPVDSEDEIGILSQRFNQMSVALKKYINQYYVAQIKQNEAEMTALKSQIYPHFLYNTLEVIRMTALEEKDGRKVSRMIEALAAQIRYMIGPMQDMVPAAKEIEIVEKYVYLLNCRINGNIKLNVQMNGYEEARVPKLILQPIVENAYVHGLQPRGGKGVISIEIAADEGVMEIMVMDDGVGMDEATLESLYDLLKSDAIGIKREDNWQSIGMKNVHDRIHYLYGDPFGIQVVSQEQVGTMIRIVMPYTEYGKEKKPV